MPSAVLYGAHAVLTRGRRVFSTSASVFVEGSVSEDPNGIFRYVHSPATNGQAAHLVAGWKQDASAAAALLLSTNALIAYMGHQPAWWSYGANCHVLPDAVGGEEAANAYWRDVCMAICFRRHGDDVELVQVDLRPGLYDGSNAGIAPTAQSECACYAYDDLAKLGSMANESTSLPSHAAPNDIVVANFLKTATLVNNYVGVNSVDAGLHYRRFVNLYAVHRDDWDELFVETQQSTIFYKLAFEATYGPTSTDLAADAANVYYDNDVGLSNLNACLRECAGHAGSEPALTGRMNVTSMVYDADTGRCICTSTDWLALDNTDRIGHYPSRTGFAVYSVKFCPGVAGGSPRSVVYRKGVTGANAVCMGYPVAGGAVLTNGSIFFSRDAGDDTRPIDSQCRAACDANPDCALAHSFVESFDVLNGAHNLPPPPSPPAPPQPPPPNVPPLPPFPPAPPPGGAVGLRTWSPAGYNDAPGGDPDGASDGLFHLTCGFGEGTCNDFQATIFSSVSQTAVLETARKLIDQGTYKGSVCPYECERVITQHSVSDVNALNLLSGAGLQGERFLYPGIGQSAGGGFSRFQTTDDASSINIGGQLLHPLRMERNVTLEECNALVQSHRLLAPHAVWLIDAARVHAVIDSERLGECGLFLGTRSPLAAQLWRAFYKYARLVLRLGHFDAYVDDDIKAALVHTAAEGDCSTSTSQVCVWWSEMDLDDQEYSCRVKADASNIVTPSVLLAQLSSSGISYPPPSPPPPSPPVSPPSPSPPPGAVRCELSAVPTTDARKVVRVDADGNDVIVDKKCWRWDPQNDWPPFVVHRDAYAQSDRCYGIQTRDVQWHGGFRQPLLSYDAHDPYDQNNNDCPWRDRLIATNQSSLLPAVEKLMEDGLRCMDGSVATAFPRVCELGTQMRSCGVHQGLVVFGHASNHVPGATPGANQCILKSSGAIKVLDDGCHDGGPGSISSDCFYGTHPDQCGRRRFAFLADDAGPDVPDQSCGDANNICEDGLMWSHYAPGLNPCAPNTDEEDCGWRMPKRTARIEVASEDSCRNECSETAVNAGTNKCGNNCSDQTDDVFTSLLLAEQCGRGTQTAICKRVADDALAGMDLVDTDGRFDYSNNVFRPRTIYVNARSMGSTTCTAPINLEDSANEGPDKVCSDGGLGSRRVRLSVPNHAVPAAPFTMHEFICPYGSQPGVCPNRTLEVFRATHDELAQPSGPEFKSCFDDTVGEYECCRAEHSFRITGERDTVQSEAAQDANSDAYCAYPCGGDSTLSCTDENGADQACPDHWTSYDHTPTGCERYCNVAFRRAGNDDTCLPAKPECANWNDADSFPKEFLTVTAWCICGALLPELVDAGRYVDRGTILEQYRERQLSEDNADDGWQWDEAVPEGIRQFHGAHFDVPDQCLAAIMDFRTSLIPNASQCANYMDLLAPPLASWDPSFDYGDSNLRLCSHDNVADDNCCVEPRGTAAMSRIWTQTSSMSENSVAAAFASSHVVGTAVHQSEVAAVGNFDDDALPDIVIGNRLFLGNTDNAYARRHLSTAAAFVHQPGIPIGARDFAQVYAGDVDGHHPDDIVAVYADGAVEVFLSIFEPANAHLSASGGVGFRSAGIVLAAGVATVTTVAFLGTFEGYGMNCRGADFGCVSQRRAVFVGTSDTSDYIFVSPDEYVEIMDFTVRFSPLENSNHRTLSSAVFFSDYHRQHQALAIGTGRESPNALAYLGISDFARRPFGSESYDETVAVSVARMERDETNMDGSAGDGNERSIACFANFDTPNRCVIVTHTELMADEHKVLPDLSGVTSPPPPPPPPPPSPPPSPARATAGKPLAAATEPAAAAAFAAAAARVTADSALRSTGRGMQRRRIGLLQSCFLRNHRRLLL